MKCARGYPQGLVPHLVLSGDTIIFPKIDELMNHRWLWLRLPRDRNCDGEPDTPSRLVTHDRQCDGLG